MAIFMKNCEIQNNLYDIIAINETSLNEFIPEQLPKIKNYVTYRCDRNLIKTQKDKGGGVCIVVKNSLSSRIIYKYTELYERLDMIITKNKHKLYLSLVYFPPESPAELYFEYFSSVTKFIQEGNHTEYLILGYFNLPGYDWPNLKVKHALQGYHPSSNIRESANIVFNFIRNLNAHQGNNYVNKSGNTLDLMLTNSSKNIEISESLDPLSVVDIYHGVHTITIKSKIIFYQKNVPHKYNFSKGNFNAIKNSLKSINWSSLKAQCKNSNEYLNVIYKELYENIENHNPKILDKHSNFPSFFSRELCYTILKKRVTHFYFKIYKTEYYKNKFIDLRNTCTFLHNRDYKTDDS